MKKTISIALAFAVTGVAVGSFAAFENRLRGSDTLESLTEAVLVLCPAASPLVYIGGGSSNGEDAMRLGQQEVSPMSRFLDLNRSCRADDPREAEGLMVALDALAIVTDSADTQCGGATGSVAFTGSINVTDQNGVAGVQCPGCDAGNTTYTFANEFDALRVLFSGMHKNGGSAIANQDCNSDVRRSLANSWDAFHEGTCTSGACSQISHAFRRDDLSGTTDTFLTLLGLPAFVPTNPSIQPFCNGSGNQDLNPIRRPCAAGDNVCQANGTSGLVLPIFLPELAPGSEATAYAPQACQVGTFALADAQTTVLANGGTRFDCPEKADFSVAGFCLAPTTASGNFNCTSPANNPNVFFDNLADDARLFNKWVRAGTTGALGVDAAGRPEINAFYRLRTATCDENSSTLAIGCLVDQVACSVGFAGREADDVFPGTKSLFVRGIAPTVPNVRKLLENPPAADRYPLSRGLFYNTQVGFENVEDEKEAALTACFNTQATADAAATSAGFITLGVAPICTDFVETSCNSRDIPCSASTNCGAAGTCTGGFCRTSCTSNAQCTLGRTCNLAIPGGRCDYPANTNACLP